MKRLCLLLSIVAIALAQEPAPVSISVDVKLVNVAFVARGERGELARDLTRDDVDVYEDGVKQDVKFFSKSGDLPLRLALVVDVSGSQNRFLAKHEKDVNGFVARAVSALDQVMLICFGNRIRVVSDYDSPAAELVKSMERFRKGSTDFPELDPDFTRRQGTALFDAVCAGTSISTTGQVRRALILFSDGEDNSSAHDLLDAIEAAQNSDTLIYSVRYTDEERAMLPARARYGIRELNRLAGETGGASFDAAKVNVGTSLKLVADELRFMYEVGYTSSNANAGTGFRKLVIRAKRPGFVVRAKTGYYAN